MKNNNSNKHKMSEIDAYHKNFIFNQQSDIFNQKASGRPEVTYFHKAQQSAINNKTSFNFLSWEESKNNNEATPISKKSRNKPNYNSKIHKNFQEKMYTFEPSNNLNNNRGQKETLFIGDYNGDEYKVKKEKTTDYNPDNYYKKKNPAQIKIEQLYGNVGRRNKSAIRRTKTDDNNVNTNSNNPRVRKDLNKYETKKVEKTKKLESLSIDRSTNNGYNPELDSKQNRVNMLRSNIFNDKKKEVFNTEANYKINDEQLQNKSKINKKENENYGKKSKYDKNTEKMPDNLDWRDAKTTLMFNSEKNKDIMKKDARQRKFEEIYGTDPILPKERVENNFHINDRNLIEKATKNMYSDLNQDKVRRISENISQIQGNQFVDNSSKYKENDNKNENVREYELNCNNVNEKEIEKAFADKGLHIYDIKEKDISVIGKKKDNKISFKIRENKNDQEFDNKIKDIQNDFKNKKKVDIKTSVKQQQKKNIDLIPNSLKWNNANSSLYTKNKNVDKTLQEKTHSKPINNGEKMTKIFVNLKYKNDHNEY